MNPSVRVSALKQLLEGGADLLDHVGCGGGAPVFVESLPVALPGQGGGAKRGHQRRVHTEEECRGRRGSNATVVT